MLPRLLCLISFLALACGEVAGPLTSAPQRLEYCGYDETPCEESAPPADTTSGWIVITVRLCPECP